MKKFFLIIISILSLIMVGCATSNEPGGKEETISLSSSEEQTTVINDLTGEYVRINDVGEGESKIDRIILFPDGTCNIHEDINADFADFINRSCTYSYVYIFHDRWLYRSCNHRRRYDSFYRIWK